MKFNKDKFTAMMIVTDIVFDSIEENSKSFSFNSIRANYPVWSDRSDEELRTMLHPRREGGLLELIIDTDQFGADETFFYEEDEERYEENIYRSRDGVCIYVSEYLLYDNYQYYSNVEDDEKSLEYALKYYEKIDDIHHELSVNELKELLEKTEDIEREEMIYHRLATKKLFSKCNKVA